MRTRKIQNTLKAWSPHGLCSERMIRQNGTRAKTIGCAVGALVLGAVPAKKRKLFAELAIRNGSVNISDLTDTYSQVAQECDPPAMEDLLSRTYGLTEMETSVLIEYNDGCVDETGQEVPADTLANSCTSGSVETLPLSLRKTVVGLRRKNLRYEKRRYYRDIKAARIGAPV